MSTRVVRAMVAGAALMATVAADAPREVFDVGVLRRDGIIVPFAAYDGKRWSAPWPLPSLDLTVPITLSAVPSSWWGPAKGLDTWQASTTAGDRAVRVVQPDWVDAHCTRQIGLRTDYHAAEPVPPRGVQPYPKDGLAVAPPRAVERIEVLQPTAAEVRPLQALLRTSFNEAERRVEDEYGHPIARRGREGIEPVLEAAYAWGDSPRIYYVEVTRTYRQLGLPAGDCTAIGFGTGWFVRDGSGVRLLTMAADVLGCERYGASYMLPLGAMRLRNQRFWLAQFSGWDHERYVVLEIDKKHVEVVVNTWGGGCP